MPFNFDIPTSLPFGVALTLMLALAGTVYFLCRRSFYGRLSDLPGLNGSALATPQQTSEAVDRRIELLKFVAQLQTAHLSGVLARQILEQLLKFVIAHTQSQSGFVGEVFDAELGTPSLSVASVENKGWDSTSRTECERQIKQRRPFQEFAQVFQATIKRREAVISNTASEDAGLAPFPYSDTPTSCMLTVPLIHEEVVVGVLGLANRQHGYNQSWVAELHPLLSAAANLIVAGHDNRSRVATDKQLRRTFDALVEQRSRVQEYAAELEAKNCELEEARRRAEASNLAKSEFLANMSHEIRTPMTAMLGFADVLLEDGDIDRAPPSRIEVIRTIQRNGMHLLGLINDILDLSKIEAGKLAVEQVTCRPAAIIKEVLSLMCVRAEQRQIALNLRYENETPEEITSDPTRIRQILMNLIGNAIKFTEAGSVTLAVRFVDAADNPRLEFDVIDTGMGMTPDQQKHLFQSFSQADTSMSRRFGGTGLGLAISLRLADLLGGKVSLLQSEPGVGSTFRFSIGAEALTSTSMVDPEKACSESSVEGLCVIKPNPPDCLQGCRVLVAEDGPDNQRLIRYFLEKAGAAVTMVENGQLAFDAALDAERQNQAFHVILTDIQMPVLDGYEATARLRTAGYRGPIIALTAHAMEGEREKCIAVGCDDFASKPIQRAHLISQVESLYRVALKHHQPIKP